MPDLDKLTKKVIAFRDARDWAQFHNPKDVAISLSLEASELLEHFQWKDPAETASHARTGRAEIAEELADVLYWVLLLGHDLGIELDKALSRKLLKNAKKYPISKAKGRHTKYDRL